MFEDNSDDLMALLNANMLGKDEEMSSEMDFVPNKIPSIKSTEQYQCQFRSKVLQS